MEIRITLTGPFPRSEELVRATRDLDRGRQSPEAVEEIYARTEIEVVDLERRLGTDRCTAGYLRWADLFRPIAESWGGFAVGPITRWFETNTFYRQPILHAPPERTPGAIASRLPLPLRGEGAARALVILPGPYTLAGLLDNRSGEAPQALTHRLGRLLAEEVRELRGLGYRSFEWAEPLLVTRTPTGPSAESTVESYRAIHDAAGDSTSIVWTYFGDAAPAVSVLARLPVSVIGVDLAETDPASFEIDLRGRALGLGVIDPRTTLSEDPGEIVRIVRRLQEQGSPREVWLGNGAPLDLLPAEPAAKKLHVLAAARTALTPANGRRS